MDSQLNSEEQEKLTSRIKKFISDIEGKVENIKEWGKKDLTYPIKKRSSGVYFIYDLSVNSEKINSLKQRLQNEDNILRFLMVVTDKGGK